MAHNPEEDAQCTCIEQQEDQPSVSHSVRKAIKGRVPAPQQSAGEQPKLERQEQNVGVVSYTTSIDPHARIFPANLYGKEYIRRKMLVLQRHLSPISWSYSIQVSAIYKLHSLSEACKDEGLKGILEAWL